MKLKTIILLSLFLLLPFDTSIFAASENNSNGNQETLTGDENAEHSTTDINEEDVVEGRESEEEVSKEEIIEIIDRDEKLEETGNDSSRVNKKTNEENTVEIQEVEIKKLSDGPTYEIGDKGEHVRELKLQLTALGFGNFPRNPSDAYGNVTANVVKDFQTYYGLPVTGIADEVTRSKMKEVLDPPYRSGDRGTAIVKLKQNLSALGYGNFSSNPSIFYGSVTAKVVKDFQRAFGLSQSGVADQTTLNKIDEILKSKYRNGERGEHVRELKNQLTALGFGNFPRNPSNAYGKVTANVVKEFQTYYGLPVTGIADEVTRSKMKEVLDPPYKSGDRGTAIVKLKQNLSELGYGNFPSNPSIFYGSATKRVVEEFQKANGLIIDGIAGNQTLSKIEELLKIPKEIIDETPYNISFNRALDIQMKQLNLTDSYRSSNAYIHKDYLRFIGSAQITSNTATIRSSSSTASNKIDTVKKGATVIITGYVDNGQTYNGSRTWYKIDYKNKTRYIHSSLVQGDQAVASTRVNVRSGQGTGYSILGHVDTTPAERVRILSHGTTWHRIDASWIRPTLSDLSKYLNPDSNDKFQHLRLDSSVNVSAVELNKVLSGKGILSGKGQAFINGAQKHGVNEAYLIAHAILETGHGSSTLANGVEVGKDSNGKLVRVTSSNRKNLISIKKTYNMFGIGAADSCAVSCGAIKAYEEGWFTPEAAIEGGAAWIGRDYIYNEHRQNTLYKMKWNPRMSEGFAWKQYATDIAWAEKQTERIKEIYNQLENPSYHFDIPKYN